MKKLLLVLCLVFGAIAFAQKYQPRTLVNYIANESNLTEDSASLECKDIKQGLQNTVFPKVVTSDTRVWNTFCYIGTSVEVSQLQIEVLVQRNTWKWFVPWVKSGNDFTRGFSAKETPDYFYFVLIRKTETFHSVVTISVASNVSEKARQVEFEKQTAERSSVATVPELNQGVVAQQPVKKFFSGEFPYVSLFDVYISGLGFNEYERTENWTRIAKAGKSGFFIFDNPTFEIGPTRVQLSDAPKGSPSNLFIPVDSLTAWECTSQLSNDETVITISCPGSSSADLTRY